MSDLISRQAAIEAMVCVSDSICGQQAIDALCDLPSAQQWIPCSERLPGENGEYLVSIKWESGYDDIAIYDYNTDRGWNDGDIYTGSVVAYMQLPKAWKGEQDG